MTPAGAMGARPPGDALIGRVIEGRFHVRALVAERDGVVIGFAHVRVQPDTFTAGPSWFLDDLYTDPSSRGTGAATALLGAIFVSFGEWQKARMEEVFLTAELGPENYGPYCRRVPMIVPFLRF